jgi:hypothetical protein
MESKDHFPKPVKPNASPSPKQHTTAKTTGMGTEEKSYDRESSSRKRPASQLASCVAGETGHKRPNNSDGCNCFSYIGNCAKMVALFFERSKIRAETACFNDLVKPHNHFCDYLFTSVTCCYCHQKRNFRVVKHLQGDNILNFELKIVPYAHVQELNSGSLPRKFGYDFINMIEYDLQGSFEWCKAFITRNGDIGNTIHYVIQQNPVTMKFEPTNERLNRESSPSRSSSGASSRPLRRPAQSSLAPSDEKRRKQQDDEDQAAYDAYCQQKALEYQYAVAEMYAYASYATK